MKRKVEIWYSDEGNEIALALHDKKGWWKWFKSCKDFVHMDDGPGRWGMVLIGWFYEEAQ